MEEQLISINNLLSAARAHSGPKLCARGETVNGGFPFTLVARQIVVHTITHDIEVYGDRRRDEMDPFWDQRVG